MQRRHDQILPIRKTEDPEVTPQIETSTMRGAAPMEPGCLTAELTNSYTVPLNESGYAPIYARILAEIYLPTSLLSLPLGVPVAVSGQLPTASSTSLDTPTG